MDLKEAIYKAIDIAGTPVSISEATKIIKDHDLYETSSGTPVHVHLVKSYVHNNEAFNIEENKIYKKEAAEDFEKWLFGANEVIRGHFRSEMMTKLILPQVFLLRLNSLSKDKELPKRFEEIDFSKIDLNSIRDVYHAMNLVNTSETEELSNIFRPFLQIFDRIKHGEKDRQVAEALFNLLKSRNYSKKHISVKEFGRIFSNLANNFLSSITYAGESISTNLTESLFSGIQLTKGKNHVLDPTFGIGNTMIQLVKNQPDNVQIELFGYELNEEIYAYGKMNLIANGIYSFNLFNGDSLSAEWQNDFDLIVADPPIGVRVEPLYLRGKSTKELTSDLIIKATAHLKKGGKLCFVTGDGILSKTGRFEKFRSELLDSGDIHRVIALPGGIFKANTTIPLNLFILQKGLENSSVEFIDYRKSAEKTLKESINSKDWLFGKHKLSEKNNPAEVKNNDLQANESNLLPKRYVGSIHKNVEELRKQNKTIKLKDILRRVRGHSPSDQENQQLADKLIKIQDLKEDPFEATISPLFYQSNYENIPSNRVKVIDGGVLLIARRGDKIKPTYLRIGHSVLIDQSIYAFKITGKIIQEYLFYQLHSDFFQKQLESIKRGNTIPYFSYKDILELYIKLPYHNEYDYRIAQQNHLDSKKQEAFEKAYRKKKQEADELKNKLDAVKYEESIYRDIEEEELIEYMNHNVRNKLSPVKDSIELIYDFMVENEGNKIDLSTLEGEPLKGEDKQDLSTIDDLFKSAKDGIINALRSLKRLENFRLNEYKPKDFQEVNLYKWLKRDLKSRNKKYAIEIRTKEENPEDVFNLKIVKPAIRDLIDNILDNAEKHGFEKELKNYTILFELGLLEDSIIIDYKNDGKPISKALGKEKFTSSGGVAGKTQGTGFGGFFIARTIRKHGGRFSIMPTSEESNYKVHFKINLPKNLEE